MGGDEIIYYCRYYSFTIAYIIYLHFQRTIFSLFSNKYIVKRKMNYKFQFINATRKRSENACKFNCQSVYIVINIIFRCINKKKKLTRILFQ